MQDILGYKFFGGPRLAFEEYDRLYKTCMNERMVRFYLEKAWERCKEYIYEEGGMEYLRECGECDYRKIIEMDLVKRGVLGEWLRFGWVRLQEFADQRDLHANDMASRFECKPVCDNGAWRYMWIMDTEEV